MAHELLIIFLVFVPTRILSIYVMFRLVRSFLPRRQMVFFGIWLWFLREVLPIGWHTPVYALSIIAWFRAMWRGSTLVTVLVPLVPGLLDLLGETLLVIPVSSWLDIPLAEVLNRPAYHLLAAWSANVPLLILAIYFYVKDGSGEHGAKSIQGQK